MYVHIPFYSFDFLQRKDLQRREVLADLETKEMIGLDFDE